MEDCLITGGENKVETLFDQLKKLVFNAKYLGSLNNFLGIKVTKNENHLKISQEDLIEIILKRFNIESCKGKDTPMDVNFQTK